MVPMDLTYVKFVIRPPRTRHYGYPAVKTSHKLAVLPRLIKCQIAWCQTTREILKGFVASLEQTNKNFMM